MMVHYPMVRRDQTSLTVDFHHLSHLAFQMNGVADLDRFNETNLIKFSYSDNKPRQYRVRTRLEEESTTDR